MSLLPIFLAALAAFIIYLLARSERKRMREQERCQVYLEERVENWDFPPRPRPATAQFAADHKTRTRVGL